MCLILILMLKVSIHQLSFWCTLKYRNKVKLLTSQSMDNASLINFLIKMSLVVIKLILKG